ncbi:response regulator transcription factor [Urechidicola vernalis]|uniref:LuxR C-terminal-related transcriptional regulator n=1 Tax=Urechidicola vernalis TaxID=3075600 RepID=A0ABU2Y0W2_9FLAO|nr:LuxR C-terminal-related transcriptional regulator [Urechidicola sp. P050]MDT0551809.1 LuxR C-terminal-related transcriptional regulator [Urechidicola sp. P050]
MKFKILLLFVLSITIQSYSQFKFSGEVNEEFYHSNVYLSIIDNYKQGEIFLTEKIIQEVQVDATGYFEFKGDFLASENKFYKIYIDKCSSDVTDYNHLLNHCSNSNYRVFIANNKDSIHFPLNNLNQMFCSFSYSRIQNVATFKIDSIQEVLLLNLHEAKSDEQRKIIYKNYNVELQRFSRSLNEPLAELYSYQLYTNESSFSRPYYLKDLETSDYYERLLLKLEKSYPNTSYLDQYENDIARDRLLFTKDKVDTKYLIIVILLVISVSINFVLIRKRKPKGTKIKYREVLSSQELKVFELMKQDLTNKEIAERLFVSISTIKSHINNIYSKLKISSRKDIVKFK